MKLNLTNDVPFGTNVLEIEVPEALRNKVKSGVEFIDGALGGEGFTPSQVLLFTGTPGAGKTTMMLGLSLIHISEPRDVEESRMPSSA